MSTLGEYSYSTLGRALEDFTAELETPNLDDKSKVTLLLQIMAVMQEREKRTKQTHVKSTEEIRKKTLECDRLRSEIDELNSQDKNKMYVDLKQDVLIWESRYKIQGSECEYLTEVLERREGTIQRLRDEAEDMKTSLGDLQFETMRTETLQMRITAQIERQMALLELRLTAAHSQYVDKARECESHVSELKEMKEALYNDIEYAALAGRCKQFQDGYEHQSKEVEDLMLHLQSTVELAARTDGELREQRKQNALLRTKVTQLESSPLPDICTELQAEIESRISQIQALAKVRNEEQEAFVAFAEIVRRAEYNESKIIQSMEKQCMELDFTISELEVPYDGRAKREQIVTCTKLFEVADEDGLVFQRHSFNPF